MNPELPVPRSWLNVLSRLVAPTAVVAPLLVMSAPAHAEWVYDTLPGSACSVYGESNAPGLRRTSTGIANSGASPIAVACPVVRTIAANGTGYRVYVNGLGLAEACRIFSVTATGILLYSVPMTGSTTGRRMTAVVSAALAPEGSYQSVSCVLHAGDVIHGLEFVQ